MPQKPGTNQTDRKAIRQEVEMGNTNAAQIASMLGCESGPVQKYIDELTKPKRKPRKVSEPTPEPASEEESQAEV